MELHQDLVLFLKAHRVGLVYPDFKNTDWLPQKNRDYLFAYGFPWVLDEYEPHVSLLISKNELHVKDFLSCFELPITIPIETICVGEIGQFGTVRREIYSCQIA